MIPATATMIDVEFNAKAIRFDDITKRHTKSSNLLLGTNAVLQCR